MSGEVIDFRVVTSEAQRQDLSDEGGEKARQSRREIKINIIYFFPAITTTTAITLKYTPRPVMKAAGSVLVFGQLARVTQSVS